MLFLIDHFSHLLSLLSIPAHNRKFAAALLAVPDHPFVAKTFGDADFAEVLWNLIRRHDNQALAVAISSCIAVGVSATTFSRTMSVVIPSASPSKFRITRCRIA